MHRGMFQLLGSQPMTNIKDSLFFGSLFIAIAVGVLSQKAYDQN